MALLYTLKLLPSKLRMHTYQLKCPNLRPAGSPRCICYPLISQEVPWPHRVVEYIIEFESHITRRVRRASLTQEHCMCERGRWEEIHIGA